MASVEGVGICPILHHSKNKKRNRHHQLYCWGSIPRPKTPTATLNTPQHNQVWLGYNELAKK